MEIRIDDLSGPEIQALLGEHLADMYQASPAESVHALDLDEETRELLPTLFARTLFVLTQVPAPSLDG